MTLSNSLPTLALALALAVAAALAAVAPASAQTNPYRSGTLTITGANGGVTTIAPSVSGVPGAINGSSTITGPNAHTATRDFRRGYDAATGTFYRDSTTTGPNGLSRSVSGRATAVEGGWNASRTVTQPNGVVRGGTATWRRVR